MEAHDPKSHHRDVGGGPVRAAVFGVSDGLVSNVALVMGVAAAASGPEAVRIAGIAGLIAGACSMAAGEYVSMKAQTELLEHELDKERKELVTNRDVEYEELVSVYTGRGVTRETAEKVASELMADPNVALETHAREEMGIDPDNLGSPIGAAVASFLAFCIGALVPLLPWMFGSGTSALVVSMGATIVVAGAIGLAIGASSGKSKLKALLRQIGLTCLAAGITFAASSAVGAGVGGI